MDKIKLSNHLSQSVNAERVLSRYANLCREAGLRVEGDEIHIEGPEQAAMALALWEKARG